jgi:hypothetical protein
MARHVRCMGDMRNVNKTLVQKHAFTMESDAKEINQQKAISVIRTTQQQVEGLEPWTLETSIEGTGLSIAFL